MGVSGIGNGPVVDRNVSGSGIVGLARIGTVVIPIMTGRIVFAEGSSVKVQRASGVIQADH